MATLAQKQYNKDYKQIRQTIRLLVIALINHKSKFNKDKTWIYCGDLNRIKSILPEFDFIINQNKEQ